ncbi:TIGR03619 family F420-dependent LLM class oxidoreductase [Streptomyces sp. NPDC051018]|uniref:TIGR03619 family F420-dependent LLM class oxidoreductase n=1 Tax=Streptomyces sp. NPDC051018 TaxID=3365639 RepID=UPI0037A6EDFE
MRIAVTITLTDETITPVRLARELEGRGFAGLCLPEHTHIPVERTTPFPGGGELGREYGRLIDPLVGLAQAAAVTSTLALGTGVLLVAQHDPIVLAKQIATLDHLSGGRLTLGIGYGWNREELADHGIEWSARRAVVHDRLALMRALWAPEPTAHKGEHGSVRASLAHPKPFSGTAPGILIGGAAGPRLFARIAESADGWIPVGGGGLPESLPLLRTAWEAAGRDPGTLRVVPFAVVPTPEKLAYYGELGLNEVVLRAPAGDETEVLRTLDTYARYL